MANESQGNVQDTGAIIDLNQRVQVVEGADHKAVTVVVLTQEQVANATRYVHTAHKNRKSISIDDAIIFGLDWGLTESERREARLVEMRESKAFKNETANLQSMLGRGLLTADKFIEAMGKLAEKYHVGGTAVEL